MKLGTIGAVLGIVVVSNVASAQTPAGKGPKGAQKPKSGETAPAASSGTSRYRVELPVLTLASDDVEDQAEALSGAIRSRVRMMPGVTLDDTATQNLSTFTSALGCSAKPDPLCLIKIGDQLKVERFLWGSVHKASEKGQVVAEVHLWRRGKADTVSTETFSDNLRDQNDDVLRRIAGRLVDRLLGQPVAAPITVRAGNASGDVIVDGERYALVRGETTVELKPGRYTIVVNAKGYKQETQQLEVTSTAEQVLALKLTPEDGSEPETPSSPISPRTIVALSFIGIGVGFGIAGTVKAAQFVSLQDENKRDKETLDADRFCEPSPNDGSPRAALDQACTRLKDAEKARTMEFIFYGIATVAAGTGLVLLVTDTPSKKEGQAAKVHPKPKIIPHVDRTKVGVDFSLRF